jgi:hypothetical protein
MKKLLSFFIMIIVLILFVPHSMASAAVTINKSKTTIYVGYSVKLKIDTSKYIMWKSSDKSVAKVSGTGKVTGISAGEAIVTATVGAGTNNQKLTCKVIVKARLSVDSTDIICAMDEYQEVGIYFDKQREDETIWCLVDNDSVAEGILDVDSDKYILRIIPDSIGKITMTIHTGTNESWNDGEFVKINVTVLNDSEWISQTDLNYFDIMTKYDKASKILSLIDMDYMTNLYEITRMADDITDSVAYSGDEISYKLIGKEFYFKVDDLQALKII